MLLEVDWINEELVVVGTNDVDAEALDEPTEEDCAITVGDEAEALLLGLEEG